MHDTKWLSLPIGATWGIVFLLCAYLAADLTISREHTERQAVELASSYVRLVEEHASSVFDRGNLVLSRAVGLVTPADITAARRMAPQRRAELQDALAAVQREYRGIVSMTATDADGYAFANTVGVAPGYSLGDRSYFLRLKEQNSDAPVLSEVIYGRLSKRWGVQIARRIRGTDGGFAGMVVANLGLSENFSDFYANLGLPQGNIILLKDLRHKVMVRWPVQEELFGQVLDSPDVTQRLNRNITEAIYRSHSPVDGKRRLLGFRKLANYPCYVIFGVADSDYLANWWAALFRAVLVALLAVIAAVIGTALFRRKLELGGALQVSEENARALLNATTDAAALFDLKGTLLRANAVLAERLGRTPQQMVGANLWDLFSPDGMDQRRQAVAEAIASGQPVALEDCQDDRHYLHNIHPVTNADGHVDRIAVFSRDVTRQFEAEARVSATLQKVERSNADLEQFAYIASHDLREPLRMVSSYVSLLGRRYADRLDDDARQFIAYAAEGAGRMDRLILDLLEYSRLRRWSEEMVPTAAAEALAVALNNLQTAISEADAIITAEPLPQVIADPTQLARLFQNLIGNALKYRAENRRLDLRIGAERQGDRWMFFVRDNGIGIEPEYHERIFGIFQRLHTRDKYEGTGIGLAICRGIVDRHGGRIWVESVPGESTTFRFTIKAA